MTGPQDCAPTALLRPESDQASYNAWQKRHGIAQDCQLVVRIMLVHVSRFMSGQRHPSLFTHAGVCQDRRKRMSQTVKTQCAHTAPGIACALANLVLLYSRAFHDFLKGIR